MFTQLTTNSRFTNLMLTDAYDILCRFRCCVEVIFEMHKHYIAALFDMTLLSSAPGAACQLLTPCFRFLDKLYQRLMSIFTAVKCYYYCIFFFQSQ